MIPNHLAAPVAIGTSSIGSAFGFHLRRVITAITFVLCTLVSQTKAAQIGADFNDGNTNTSPDGYVGMAGNGWLGPWTTSTSGCTFTNTVASGSPLGGGGNYLHASLTSGTASGGWPGTVGRKFDTAIVSATSAYSVSFKLRLDTSMANQSDALVAFGDIGSGYTAGTGSGNTWLISGYYNNGSPIWTFFDGNRNGGSTRVLSNLPLTSGTVYSFVVNVDPASRSWTVAIDNGSYIYQSPVFGFRNAAPVTAGNTVYFGATVRNTTGTLGYSVDGVGISSGTGALPGSQERVDVAMDTTWKFATDPNNVGISQQWYSDGYNDSSWQNLKSGSSWESQGVTYAGYAWYRQQIVVPAGCQGVPVRLNLASFFSDDDVYFNGVRVGGIKGSYKYDNLQDREYSVPASLIRYGQPNTIAIRIWGDNFYLSKSNDGLIAGTYTLELDPYRVMARDTGGSNSSEQPIELYDLSAAQQGKTFEVVFRYPQSILTGSTANLSYTLRDFYGSSIQSGSVPVSTGTDGIVRGVASVSLASSRTLYLAGRFKAALVLKDGATGATLSSGTTSVDYLSFSTRDVTQLPALSGTYDSTPYGTLKLVDFIDCSTATSSEVHPYMQSAFGQHAQDYCTPGAKVTVSVDAITPSGTATTKSAREINNTWGWFAYRIGRGALTPGKTYLLRIEYPEDKPRYCPIEVQAGNNYMDVGWKNGLGATDVYDNWPLSGGWQYYDVIVPLDDQSVGTGGTGDSDPQNGIWVYVMNKMKPGYYFKLYSGGPAVATMRLYEIDPAANAPSITLPPSNLPRRTLMFDWERQAEQNPGDIVNYAKLMGYSAVSPIMMKWALDNYGDPTNGYYTDNIDDAGYVVTNMSNPAQAPIAGVASIHQQYLTATKNSGVNYIPRFEYGGSNNLPAAAYAINSSGSTAQPSRYSPAWCANLLNPATFTDLKVLMDGLFQPYAASNPQLKGALWRIREDRMQVSYGPNDVAMFGTDTGTTIPTGYSNSQLAAWASSGTVGAAYSTWWQQKRAAFHQQLVSLLQSYRSDMTLYYYNWDADKFSMLEPDTNSATFYGLFSSTSAATTAYNNDRAARATFTANDYINVMTTGSFSASGAGFSNRPDYALRPSLYSSMPGIELLAPANYRCYADQPDYLNYFQTADGLAASNCVPYDEIGSREPNPKFECNMMTPGGSAFSMALELLAYFHGDARTLTYTSYTYGRGFADAHRRFAQAFLALPAVPGTVVSGTDPDVKVRTYSTSNGTYVGVAYKGYSGKSLTVTVPGMAGMTAVNLVTGAYMSTTSSGNDLQFSVGAGPMELDAFLVTTPPPVITSGTVAGGTAGSMFTYQMTATNNPSSYGANGLPAGLVIDTATGLISGTATSSGTSSVLLMATNSGGTGTATLTLTMLPAPPVITSATTATATVNSGFSYQVTATNNPASYGATGLPGGLSIDTATGLISGTVTSSGTSVASISATNPGGTGTANLTIAILPSPPVVTSGTTASATVNSAFSYQITATNSPTSFGATGLPAGLAVNASTGLISGTATSSGTSNVSVSATNAGGTGTATLVLAVQSAAPVITSATTVAGGVNSAFTYQITATNNPTSYNATGLPSGLSVNTSTGLISGTLASSGTSNITVSASNAVGTGTANVTLTVSATAIVANFTAGNTTTSADGYTGTAGSGWLGPWTTTVSGCTFSNTVASTSPLGGGGNYLQASLVSGTAAGGWIGSVGRKFDTAIVSATSAYTVSFKVRLDSAMKIQSDSVVIFGDVGTGYTAGTGSGNTWVVSGYYNNNNPVIWSVLNGDRAGGSTRVLTTMPLNVGTVYSMTVSVDPVSKSWNLTIDDGTTQYHSGTLGFRNAAPNGSGNTLYFGADVRDTTGTLGYSVDSVSISQ